MNLREHDLSAARTNIYPHRRQENIILLPERVILERSLVKVIVVVMVVMTARNVDVLVKYPIVVVRQSMRKTLVF